MLETVAKTSAWVAVAGNTQSYVKLLVFVSPVMKLRLLSEIGNRQ